MTCFTQRRVMLKGNVFKGWSWGSSRLNLSQENLERKSPIHLLPPDSCPTALELFIHPHREVRCEFLTPPRVSLSIFHTCLSLCVYSNFQAPLSSWQCSASIYQITCFAFEKSPGHHLQVARNDAHPRRVQPTGHIHMCSVLVQ